MKQKPGIYQNYKVPLMLIGSTVAFWAILVMILLSVMSCAPKAVDYKSKYPSLTTNRPKAGIVVLCDQDCPKAIQ